jgi:hypothetical protein
MNIPFENLVGAFPELFGRNGSKRKELENLADYLGVDWDKNHGIDDGEGPVNSPNE